MITKNASLIGARLNPVQNHLTNRIALGAALRRMGSPATKFNMDETSALKQAGVNADALDHGLTIGIRNDLSTQSGASGGYAAPGTVVHEVRLARDSQPMTRLATMTTTDRGVTNARVTIDDRTNGMGEVLQENRGDVAADVSFAVNEFRPWKYSSGMTKVPFELIQDSPRLLEVLPRLLALRPMRRLNKAATIGTGAGESLGVSAACTKVAATTVGAIAGDDLLTMLSAVSSGVFDDPSNEPVWMAHNSLFASIRMLKDGSGKYLFSPREDRLLGWKVVRNSAMPFSVTGGSVPILFGDFRAVEIVQVGEMRIDAFLESQYASNDEVLYRSILRADSNLIDAGDHPVVGLQA